MSEGMWGGLITQFFFELTPERVLDAVEASGLRCTGRCFVLNSFENRVYEVEVEDLSGKELRRIVKFYRPSRWSREQILEEHQFLADLNEEEVPAIAPLAFPDGATLRETPQGIFYALFPKQGGRAPDELNEDQLAQVGRLIARIHQVGAKRKAAHRLQLSPSTYGEANLSFLLKNWVPAEYQNRYEAAVREILRNSAPGFAAAASQSQRIHGDCHLGNLLHNSDGYFFIDFDDMVVGPTVQDLWLLIPGRDEDAFRKREVLVDSYDQMRSLNRSALKLIEPLRALRFLHFSAWLARRWEDPAFPRAFPHFNSNRYWGEETLDLERQVEWIAREI